MAHKAQKIGQLYVITGGKFTDEVVKNTSAYNQSQEFENQIQGIAIFTSSINLEMNREYIKDYPGFVIGAEISLWRVLELFSEHVKEDSDKKDIAKSDDEDWA